MTARQEDVQNLRTAVMRYKTVDDRIRELNKQIYTLRDQRKITELEIVDIIRQPEFAAYEKLDIREDGSSIKIKKPETWNAPWSLSKSKLQEYLGQFFQSTAPKDPASCFNFIFNAHQATLRQHTFSIERVVPETE
jgi:hypothetical protein